MDPSRHRSRSPRLLLLETVTRERWVFNSRFFPFYRGCAQHLGIECRWLCFGSHAVTVRSGPTGVLQHMHMGPADLRELERHVRELRPTHVVASHALPPEALQALARGGEAPRVVCLADPDAFVGPQADGQPLEPGAVAGRVGSWMQTRTDPVLAWLGTTPQSSPLFGRYLVGTFDPAYDAFMANERAREMRPRIMLMGGIACDHAAPLARHPTYASLDLRRAQHDFGCAFCTWYRGPTSEPGDEPVGVAERQLRRVTQTALPGGRFCGVFDVFDARLLRLLRPFFEMVLALRLPPSTFCFEPRFDRALQMSDALERLLPRVARAGHVVLLHRMGLETLAAQDNETLYAKGETLEQADAAVCGLRSLRARFAPAFDFDPTWGTISCSPWTTLETLAAMVQRAIERGFDPLGVWLYTPLILFPGAPITLLAESQGDVLLDAWDDVAMLYPPSANQTAVGTLTPWRFRDPRTAAAFGLIVRFCAAALRHKNDDAVLRGDTVYEHLLASTPSPGPFDRPDLFAREAIDVVRGAATPVDVQAALDVALARYARVRAAEPGASPVRGPAAAASDDPFAHWAARVSQRASELLARHSGFAVQRTSAEGERAWVWLRRGDESVRLCVTRSRAGGTALRTGRWVSVSHHRDTAADDAGKLLAVDLLHGVLERAAGRAAAARSTKA
jgi:hypothetical protein